MVHVEQLKFMTQEYFDQIESNMVTMICAEKRKQLNIIVDCQKKEDEMMQEINKSKIACVFKNLLIAEYKEMVYESIYYPHFDDFDADRLCELERMVLNYYGQEELDNHVHDPSHYMFDDDRHFYMFYEMVESKGRKILDVAEEEYDDYENDGDLVRT